MSLYFWTHTYKDVILHQFASTSEGGGYGSIKGVEVLDIIEVKLV